MIDSGAVPADRSEHSQASEHSEASETSQPANEDSATAPGSNDLSPEYANDTDDDIEVKSPFSSGNPIDLDSEAPQDFSAPDVDEIEAPSGNVSDLNLGVTPVVPLKHNATQASPEGAFQPFDPQLFKIKSQSDTQMPLEQQPSILIDKVSEASQPGLSSLVPPATQQLMPALENRTGNNDFQNTDFIVITPTTKQQQAKVAEPVSEQAESQPLAYQPLDSELLSQLTSNADLFVPEPVRQPEVVVEGELYEEPIVLYAQPRRVQQISTPAQTQDTVRSASTQQPIEHHSITQNSELDPVYGLPLSNNVSFDSLPVLEVPQAASPADPQHLHVHIHHEYGSNAALVQGQMVVPANQSATNVQIVYRDDKGRMIMAPPTPAVAIAEPNGDQRTYYIPPKQILRLKAVSPIGQPRFSPSVASIQMRDTVVQGGKHLLTIPEYQARPVHRNHGLPGIDHEKLREAFKTFPSTNPLR